jgi:hypothetical protein
MYIFFLSDPDPAPQAEDPGPYPKWTESTNTAAIYICTYLDVYLYTYILYIYFVQYIKSE